MTLTLNTIQNLKFYFKRLTDKLTRVCTISDHLQRAFGWPSGQSTNSFGFGIMAALFAIPRARIVQFFPDGSKDYSVMRVASTNCFGER